jgi:hypothetical protein
MVSLSACTTEQKPSLPSEIYINQSVSSPADIIQFKGKYVVTELYNNRLAILDSPTDQNPTYFDPTIIGKSFSSPHYLAVTSSNTLLITNGWGNSIVEITDLEGSDWREFRGQAPTFLAPHGICVSDNGEIYVADSLNSRLVRFLDMDGRNWEVFPDNDRKISYGRQLHCENERVWISNSYEDREGLNPGKGGNILLLENFRSGELLSVFERPDTNLTAVLPLDGEILAGLWGSYNQVASVSIATAETSVRFWGLDSGLGTPYSLQLFDHTGEFRYGAAMIGKLDPRPDEQTGGIVFFNL